MLEEEITVDSGRRQELGGRPARAYEADLGRRFMTLMTKKATTEAGGGQRRASVRENQSHGRCHARQMQRGGRTTIEDVVVIPLNESVVKEDERRKRGREQSSTHLTWGWQRGSGGGCGREEESTHAANPLVGQTSHHCGVQDTGMGHLEVVGTKTVTPNHRRTSERGKRRESPVAR